MIKINSPKIDNDILIEEIEQILYNYREKPKKQENNINNNKQVYQVDDFTKYHDIDFIENIYKIILQRNPDKEGLDRYLELLRRGKRSKTEILATIRFSKEGREKDILILGIKKRYIMTLLYRIPIVNFFIKLISLPRLIERLNRFENHYFIDKKVQDNLNIGNITRFNSLENGLNTTNTKINSLENSLNTTTTKINSLENSLNTTNTKINSLENDIDIDIKELSFRIKEISRAKDSLKEMEKSLSNIVKNIKHRTSTIDIVKTIDTEKNSSLDELYISFEDRFRGSREDIKSRQEYYIPLIKKSINDNSDLLIDIGCGRGEWLELLKENSVRAKGIDLNRLMVKESKEYGLDTINQDAIEFLKHQKDNSIKVITGFHIVEHLPFKTLISLLDESLRVLKEGGLVIFETPNPENLIVGSCNFYTDPTHINPIPPVTLEFLAKNRGFKKVKIDRLHKVKEPSYIDIKNSEDINNLIFSATKEQDYSIIGYK